MQEHGTSIKTATLSGLLKFFILITRAPTMGTGNIS